MTTTTPTYSIGDRVIVPATPGHIDPVVASGGPGRVRNFIGSRDHRVAYVVQLDGQGSPHGHVFAPSEIKPEPTV